MYERWDSLQESLKTVVIEKVYPELDCGRYPVKREVGDRFEVYADIFKEGHDVISAALKYRRRGARDWQETPMRFVDNDRWGGGFELTENAYYEYTIEAWPDHFESWREEVHKKLADGQNVELELLEGRGIVEAATGYGKDPALEETLRAFDAADYKGRLDLLLSGGTRELMARHPDRARSTHYDKTLEVFVDRVEARYAAWYEMFHRSQGTEPGKSATFKDCEARLPYVKELGFDVVYFVPIHPIGKTYRKGPNNTLNAGPDDPGSPYAIGSEEGGHKSVHPDLGTLEDFRSFVAACREQGMEVALDFAIQCSPDHPYIREHPEWFQFRPDGTIKYAENPPKKYQDIVNVDFYSEEWEEVWREWRDVLLFWIGQGVKIFRVDNPHTKPFAFWEWVIGEIREQHPEVIFLSEAFTRPKVMKNLAKLGFSQSYTYFTWRNFKQELTEYLEELTQSEVKEYMRPNFFTSTPDILPPILVAGGRPAFQMRLVLAATLSSVYGIYNGYELCENTPVPGKEEYLNSEKYEYKVWDWDRPGNIKDYVAKVNHIRRENPALHELENLRFHRADDDNVIFYGKTAQDNTVLVAVNLDPFEAHETTLHLPLEELGIGEDENFQVEELLTDTKRLWRGRKQRVRLDPHENPAEIYRVERWAYRDYAEPCF
jgi:starch synthase (maltosyl-transferring)